MPLTRFESFSLPDSGAPKSYFDPLFDTDFAFLPNEEYELKVTMMLFRPHNRSIIPLPRLGYNHRIFHVLPTRDSTVPSHVRHCLGSTWRMNIISSVAPIQICQEKHTSSCLCVPSIRIFVV